MKMSTICRYHPFLWLGGFTLFVMAVGRWIPFDYDDRGIGTAWFLFTYALTFVFRMASAAADFVVRDHSSLRAGLTLLLGIVVYVAADMVMTRCCRDRD